MKIYSTEVTSRGELVQGIKNVNFIEIQQNS